MLYIFHGTDISKSLNKAQTLLESLRNKRPDASFVVINGDNWSDQLMQEHIGGQGLFSNKYLVFLDRVSENAEAKEKLPEYAEEIKKSDNIFVVLEGKLTADFKKSLEKLADKAVVSELVEKGFAKKEFSIFALGDALGSRNAIRSWILYRQAIDAGFEPENIIGTLFWQTKAIILSRVSKSASEAGLSPFVYNNSKRFADNFSSDELKNLMTDLITIYHDSHRGLVNSELAVERLLLGWGR